MVLMIVFCFLYLGGWRREGNLGSVRVRGVTLQQYWFMLDQWFLKWGVRRKLCLLFIFLLFLKNFFLGSMFYNYVNTYCICILECVFNFFLMGCLNRVDWFLVQIIFFRFCQVGLIRLVLDFFFRFSCVKVEASFLREKQIICVFYYGCIGQ